MEDIHRAYTDAELLYGAEIPNLDFEELALIAFSRIGNKRHRLYRARLTVDPVNLSVELPCNCDAIEAVTYDWEDWRYTTNQTVNGDYLSLFIENYIEGRKLFENPFYISGKYAKYLRVGDMLYFDKDYGQINVLYKGAELDDEGLPRCTSKEIDAIACFCAYTLRFKEGWKQHSQLMLQEALLLLQRWEKLCDAARVPESISLNEMNLILDAKTNWDRKLYNKAFKPIR